MNSEKQQPFAVDSYGDLRDSGCKQIRRRDDRETDVFRTKTRAEVETRKVYEANVSTELFSPPR